MENELIAQTTPTTLIELALQKGVDTTQLKELMDLQERWEAKQAKKSFFAALSEFQSIVPEIKKNKLNKQYGNKYSEIGEIEKTIKHSMNVCGLSKRWEFSQAKGKLICTCMVSHKDGHTESTVMESVIDTSGAKNTLQQNGSTQTYLQRYTLIGALGLSTAEEDNDAAGAGKAEPKILIADLQALFELKKEFLDADQLASAEKILSKKEEKNYSRLHKFLQSK